MYGQPKVIKWRKLIVMVLLIGAVLYFYPKMPWVAHEGIHHRINTDEIGFSLVERADIVDKDKVIDSLKGAGQIVGLEGNYNNTFKYSDSWASSDNWFTNFFVERSYEMDVTAIFKMGINIDDIKPEDVFVADRSIYVALPKPTLISMEMPYDQINVRNKTGLLRFLLQEGDKQVIYGKVREMVKSYISTNPEYLDQASKGTQAALEKLLSKIPNVDNITFVTKTSVISAK